MFPTIKFCNPNLNFTLKSAQVEKRGYDPTCLKYRLEGMVEAQAPLFRTFGVFVSNVQPGGIKTAFITNAQKPDFSAIAAEYVGPIGLTLAK